MYDLIYEVAQADPSLSPARPTFCGDIYPLLERFSRSQWVNAGFSASSAGAAPWISLGPEPDRSAQRPAAEHCRCGRPIFDRFRNADHSVMQADAWPGIYGDVDRLPTSPPRPHVWMPVADPVRLLRRWAAGTSRRRPRRRPPRAREDMTPAEQAARPRPRRARPTAGRRVPPRGRVHLADAPASMYDAPFRVRRRARPPTCRSQLTSEAAPGRRGAPVRLRAGDLTRWMACPWQTDTSSCLSGYAPTARATTRTCRPSGPPASPMTC